MPMSVPATRLFSLIAMHDPPHDEADNILRCAQQDRSNTAEMARGPVFMRVSLGST